MAVIKRLDHVIVAVGDRSEWIPTIQRALALQPGRMLEGAGQGSGGFSNAEFAIGDGFLGVVEPAGTDSQLHRFVSHFGDGFYGMSIDVGDVALATAAFDSHGVDYRSVAGGSTVYAGPRRTHGVLYQVIGGMLLGPGANPRYLGLGRLTIAVDDLDLAVRDYERIFDLTDHGPIEGSPPGSQGTVFRLAGSDLGQTIALVTPTEQDGHLAHHLKERGEGIYSFSIAVSDLDGEVNRLQESGVAFERTVDGVSVDPAAVRGLRIELAPAG